jgi:signal transduction histidine kinase
VLIQQTEAQVELSELPSIHADPLQMRQLLQNLIGNALKFRRKNEPPRVKIYSQIIDNREQLTENLLNTYLCQITVEDNGIGFDQKYCDRIFQVFQRLHGLAICRKIVERHGGSIAAESKPSQGAKFIVTLPMHQSID